MARLDFLWQLQARDEKLDMEALQVGNSCLELVLSPPEHHRRAHVPHHQSSNRRILFNLLPAHVATHFLDNQFRSNMVNIHLKVYHWKEHSYIFAIAMVLQPRIITLE